MSEFMKHGDDDALEALFASDTAFMKRMEALNEEMDEATLLDDMFDAPHGDTDPRGAYYTEPVDATMEVLRRVFVEFFADRAIDDESKILTQDEVDDLTQRLALELYADKHLEPGDIISTASSAIIIDIKNEEDDAAVVIGIGDNESVAGVFRGAVIGPVPDDLNLLTQGEAGTNILGIGVIIGAPVVVTSDGQRHHDAFEGESVILMLGTPDLHVVRHRYKQNEVYETPPTDE